jgi:hypothetical protein
LIPALLAVGGCLVAAPATALELADVKVHSTLGQPLRASIAYALGPNEVINDTCVTLQSGASSSGLPSLRRASIIVADGVIAVTGSAVVREPMMTMRINIRCHYTARLSREYMLFIDPAGMTPQAVAAPVAAAVISPPAIRPATVTARRRPVNRDPITDVTRYQVQPGDSLSEIAQRIENRPIGLWPTVNVIFDANPDAFIDNDPNKIKAGSWLELPDFAVPEPQAVADVSATTYEPAELVEPLEPVSTAYAPPDFEPAEQPVTDNVASANTISALADLRPGDVIIDASPFVAPIELTSDETVGIPDTVLAGPVTSSSSPNVPVAVIRPAAAAEQSSTNWLAWLAGGGIAIILGLLFFGRFRDRFGSAPIGVAVAPQRRQSDGNTERLEAIGDIDIDIADDSPTAENLALDADLFIGTGLQETDNVDISPDFGFATATDVDIELPEEMSSGGVASAATDIIPPLKIDADSILMSEVLPEEDEEDDYDMSVMIDATKMPRPEDITERDLEAIQVDSDDEPLISGDYTLSQEVDYKIIEKDYEDEMTATQAVNKEIAKAAAALADSLDENGGNETSALPLATVTELDVTAQLPANDDDEIGDLDDTGINPTVNMNTEDNTVEMDIEPGKIDTKTG